jgi:hypothetical protein
MGILYPQFRASSITKRMVYRFEVRQSAALRVHGYPLFVIREEGTPLTNSAARIESIYAQWTNNE